MVIIANGKIVWKLRFWRPTLRRLTETPESRKDGVRINGGTSLSRSTGKL